MFKSKMLVPIVVSCCLVAFIVETAEAQGLNFVPTSVDPIVNSSDGQVTFDAEWASASAKLDINNEGTVYAQAKFNWLATSPSWNSVIYPGVTAFVLHDISKFVTQEMDDYNVFHFTHQCGLKVTVWVLANGDALDDSSWLPGSGLEDSSLIPEGAGPNKIIDTGFIVRLGDNPSSDRHWFPGMPEPGDPTFNWFDWYGVFGTSGFNDSAFQHHLPYSVPGSNEIYELAIHCTPCDEPLKHCMWILLKFHDRCDGVAGPGWIPVLIIEPCHFPPLPEPNEPNEPKPQPVKIFISESETPRPRPVTDPNTRKLFPFETFSIHLTASASNGATPTFSSSAPTVPGAGFVDHGDGTATLTITPSEQQIGQTFKIGVVATDGVVDSDTLVFGYVVTPEKPADGEENVSVAAVLGWIPGPYADRHDVYFGTDEAKVTDANRYNQLGVLVQQDLTSVRPVTNYDPAGLLDLSTTYYWRIDDVNMAEEPNIRKGCGWHFTTCNYLVVEDFDSYANDTAVKAVWTDGWVNGSRAEVSLETDPNYTTDGNSMKYTYTNAEDPYYAEAYAATTALPSGIGSNWAAGGVKALSLWFYGQAGNDANERMYVKLQDADSNSKVWYPTEMADDVKEEQWHEWNIKLASFTGVTLTNVTRITVGFGDGTDPYPASGTGTVYFEDIRLYPPRCLPEYGPAGDITGDCVVNYEDLDIIARDWLADVFFGLGHTPLGQAQLSVDSNGLVVSNIGSSGEDGVRIALPDNITLWDANILDLGDPNDPLNPIPDGAFIEVTSRGIVDGIPDSNVSVVRHEDTGAQVTTTVDFSALGPASLTAYYYLEGDLVLIEPDINAIDPGFWAVPSWPHDVGVSDEPWPPRILPLPPSPWPPLPEVDTLISYYRWPSPFVTTPMGNLVRADRIRIIAVDLDAAFGGYSHVSLTAAHIPSITITGEAVHLSTGAPFTSTDITGDGKVNFKDYAVMANQWLEEQLWP
jgi:hypothetical protein